MELVLFRIAQEALRIIRRQLEGEEEHLAAEWAGLDGVLGPTERPEGRAALRQAIQARTSKLCERILRGDADAGPFQEAVLAHVRRTVRVKLLVSNPGWIGAGQRSEG